MKSYNQLLKESHEYVIPDLQLLRDGIIEEVKAISLYEQKAELAADPRVKRLFMDIAKEEKIHQQEFEGLIELMDPEYVDAGEKAGEELSNMFNGKE